jgi:uncharacterized protein (DUF697 family)
MDQDAIADQIIEDHTVYAAAAGAIPVPLADVAAVAAIQIDLVRALANVYEVPFDVATGKALIASLTGASAARFGASAVKAIPGVGSIGGGIAQVGLSGASTYAVGHLFRRHFADQGTLAELDVEASRSIYRGLLERGKDVVGTLRPSRARSVEDTATLLERLARLRDEEVISAAEFEDLKGAVLSRA